MKTLFAAAFLVATAAGFSAASAMPIAPASTGTDVIHVAGGCGPGFHRGPRGGCRANAVIVVRPAVRRCPPGMGMTRFGCRRR